MYHTIFQMHKDDTLYLDAYEKMLDAWMTFLGDGAELLVEGALKHNAIEIFNGYLKCHLSPPDGTRSQVMFPVYMKKAHTL